MRELSRWPCCYIKRLPKMENWDTVTLKYTEKISFADAGKRLQPSFDPSKDSYATVTQTPSQSSRPLPPLDKKIRLPIDFRTEIEYLKYILNYCLTRLDTLDEITPENPVPRVASSSDETPPPSQTTPEQKNETTITNAESTMQSAASNDVNNDENEIEMLIMSNKRTFNEDSSAEDTNNPLPTKKAATSSPASQQSGTRVPKRGEGEIYLRSLPTLPSLEDGGPVREISLPHGLPVSQTTQVRDPRVLPKVIEIAVQ